MNTSDYSEPSNEVQFGEAGGGGVGPIPTNCVATLQGTEQILVTWDYNPAGATLDHFEVEVHDMDTDEYLPPVNASFYTQYAFLASNPFAVMGHTYRFRVRAITQ